MLGTRKQLLIFLIAFFSFVAFSDDTPIKRVSYNIPLLKLSLMNNGTSVRVFKNKDHNDYALISLTDDQFVKNNRDKVVKTTYKEYKHHAHRLSDFEVKYILMATRSLEETMEDFDKNLQQHRWGQCVYLDGFLPKFIRNYYMLLAIARNNPEKYYSEISLFKEKYEVSLNSPLSDQRVITWMKDPVWLMKLRIASKELAHQLRLWEKRELSNKNRNPEVVLCSKVEESLDLFIRIYFGIKTPQKHSRKNLP